MVRDSSAFQDIQERLKTASSSLVTYFFKIDNENGAALSGLDKIRIDIRELNRNSQGIDSIFALRARELFLTTHIDAAIDENVSIQKQLDSSVMTLVRDAEFNEQGDAEALIQSIQISKVILLLIVTLSLIAAGSIGFFYVQRHLVNRLTGMGTAMRKLAAGDIDTSILSAGETDEIGEMARSLEFFRAGEIERRSLLDRERSEQKLQRDRTANMEHMISDFRAIITTVISSLAENVLRMEGTATTLSMISQDADQQARAVSRSSETTSTNVQSVSGATTQLGISIHEINEKTSRARAVTRIATDTTRSTDELVSKLSKNAAQVGDVTELISGIAARTNLLALNASIEAARAGEFGRGFSVVASEVKELATQTANATQEISTKIEAMQDFSRQAVAAIQSIGSVMDDINSFTTAIAVAVEQQAASTEMIAENVQEAAVGAADVSFKMSVVTQAIDDTNRSAAVVQDISHVFSMQARTLESAVDDFLKRVTAA
jgi:methyl-accepting chemotaxis protein